MKSIRFYFSKSLWRAGFLLILMQPITSPAADHNPTSVGGVLTTTNHDFTLASRALTVTGQDLPAAHLRCHGTEPFWSMQISPGRISLQVLGVTDTTELKPTWPTGVDGTSPSFIQIYRTKSESQDYTIVVKDQANCNNGMSDEIFDYEIFVIPGEGQGLYGCCEAVH